jgi:transposase
MRTRKPFPDHTAADAAQLMKERRRAPDYRRFQVVYLAAGKQQSDEQISHITGYSVSRIRAFLAQCRRDGVASLREKPRGGRRYETMTFAEEAAFLAPFIELASHGGVLVVNDMYTTLKKHTGKDISLATIYNILHRHNWRKIAPRRYHPKRQTAAQETFKKNLSAGHRTRRKRS